jgi:trimeric autotransporter adhesin
MQKNHSLIHFVAMLSCSFSSLTLYSLVSAFQDILSLKPNISSCYQTNSCRRMTLLSRILLLICLFYLPQQSWAQSGPTCTSKEYIYLNEPSKSSILKFEVGSNVALTEVTGSNGGPHWYPGTGTSQIGAPHGLGTDLNGRLYIHENGIRDRIFRLNCDGVIDPTNPTPISTTESASQNLFSIGNTLYHNSDGGPSAYNTCSGTFVGKMCLNGASGNLWGLSYNPVTQMVYASQRDHGVNVWAFTKAQLEAGIAGNPGPCINPLFSVPSRPRNGGVFGVVGDNAGNIYVVRSGSTIFKYNAAGTLVAEVDIQAKNLSPAGIVWSENTNRLYISNLDGTTGFDCISVLDAATMTYLGTGIPNPAGNSGGAKAIAILREACPQNLPSAFSAKVCGGVGQKFFLNQEAFRSCDGIVCGSSWTPVGTPQGMTFDNCDNSVTITGEGCTVFQLNIGAVSSTGCGPQQSTFTICNSLPATITLDNTPQCSPPNTTYTLAGKVSLNNPPTTGTLTVSVSGGGSQSFNAPFSANTSFNIAGLATNGASQTVTATFSDAPSCSGTLVYTAPTGCTFIPPCALTLRPIVSGCYQNNGSKATVSVEVAWQNITVSPTANDASDAITVTFAGQTRTINPGAYTSSEGNGSIVSPQVVAFEVPADASSQTAQVFIGTDYTSATCKAQQTGIVLPAACPPTVCVAGQTGGAIWNDFNADGIRQNGETEGLPGATVKAFDCNGNEVGSTTTDAFGKYVFTNIPASAYPIRVEFSNLPAYAGQGTLNGTHGRTTVQFVNAASCNVDLGVLDNNDYCQTNPKLVIPCYVNGNPLVTVSGTDAAANRDAIVAFDYNLTGLMNMAAMAHAPAKEVGALWGVAYNKYTKKVFSSATVKRHAGLGPLGIGGIYVSDFSTSPAGGSTMSFKPFLAVDSVLNINVGTVGSNAARGLDPLVTQPSIDNAAYVATGKAGIGGIDLSANGDTLYFTNLFDNKLYAINITAYNANGTLPTPADVKSYNMAQGLNASGGNLHIWAVKAYKGSIYTGYVADAGISQNKSDLRAFVQRLNGNTVSTIFDFPLTYPKGFTWGGDALGRTGWYPWTDDWSKKAGLLNGLRAVIHPEPILTGIEFDINGSMVLALADRSAVQSGYENYGPYAPYKDSTYFGFASGDLLRAYSNGSSFVLENNAQAGPNIGYGPNNNQGPGFGEFYNDNFLDGTILSHAELALGGLAILPGSGETVFASMDPFDIPNNDPRKDLYTQAGGIRRGNNQTGQQNGSYQIYTTNLVNGTFGKATGLGDVVLNCGVPVYLQIGNYVWNDLNKNGVQDPCEPPISNVAVELWKNGSKIAEIPTDINGEYYFSNKNAPLVSWLGTGADTTLLPNTAYEVRISTAQSTLSNRVLTRVNSTLNNGNDQNDSDGVLSASYAVISLTTGALATVNHTYDFGFHCTDPTLTNVQATQATCTDVAANNDASIAVTGIINMTRYAFGTNGTTGVSFATAIASTANSINLTNLPNPAVSTTYTIRIFGADSVCYNDTTVILEPKNCCPTITNPSTVQTICAGASGSNIIVNTTYSAANGIRFVRFANDQTATNGSETAGELNSIYTAGTALATGTASAGTATYTFNTADFPNATTAPITYYVYAILNPDPGAACRPVQEIRVIVNPRPSFSITKTDITCYGANNGTLTITASGGQSPYEYSNNNGTTYQSSNIFTNLGPALYQMTVKDANGCVVQCQ